MPLLKNNEVNQETIAAALTAAVMEFEAEENGNIYINNRRTISFPCWVKFFDDVRMIKLETFIQCKEGTDITALNEVCLKMNAGMNLVKFTTTSYEDGRVYLNGEYDMYYNFGLITEQLIPSIRRFADLFVRSIREPDPDDQLFN